MLRSLRTCKRKGWRRLRHPSRQIMNNRGQYSCAEAQRQSDVSSRIQSVTVVDRLTRALNSHGLDLVVPFDALRYNQVICGVSSHQPEQKREDQKPSTVSSLPALPHFGRSSCLAVLIGNTKALWKPFVSHLREHPALLNAANPLDQYCADALEKACASAELTPKDYTIRHVWDTHPDRVVAIQRLGHLTGLAYYDPKTFFSYHERIGPWLAFRAVVCVNAEPLAAEAKPAKELSSPCASCDCSDKQSALFECAMAAAKSGTATWRHWLAVRSACRVGMDFRYSEDQLMYHYTHDRDILRKLLRQGSHGK